MLSGWSKVVGELLEGGNAILKNSLKPAVEKLRDMRLSDLMAWRKETTAADERAENRKEKLENILSEIDGSDADRK